MKQYLKVVAILGLIVSASTLACADNFVSANQFLREMPYNSYPVLSELAPVIPTPAPTLSPQEQIYVHSQDVKNTANQGAESLKSIFKAQSEAIKQKLVPLHHYHDFSFRHQRRNHSWSGS